MRSSSSDTSRISFIHDNNNILQYDGSYYNARITHYVLLDNIDRGENTSNLFEYL